MGIVGVNPGPTIVTMIEVLYNDALASRSKESTLKGLLSVNIISVAMLALSGILTCVAASLGTCDLTDADSTIGAIVSKRMYNAAAVITGLGILLKIAQIIYSYSQSKT